MNRGMWTNSSEVQVVNINGNGKNVRAYVAQFQSPKGSGRFPLVLPDGRVLRKYWVARCVVEVRDLGIDFESFGTQGMATKKDAVALAKAMAAAVA